MSDETTGTVGTPLFIIRDHPMAGAATLDDNSAGGTAAIIAVGMHRQILVSQE